MIQFLNNKSFTISQKEYIHHYVSTFSQYDKKVRDMTLYENYVVEMNIIEKMYIAFIVFYLNIVLFPYKTLYGIPWKFAKSLNNVEYNYPHTIKDIIILPNHFVTMNIMKLVDIVLHEKVHIFQRYYPIYTMKLYIDHWHLNVYKLEKEEKERANPDISMIKFSYFNPYVNKQVYNYTEYRESPQNMKDTILKEIRLQDKSLDKSRIYYDIIHDNNYQSEHPNEIMACIITDILLNHKRHKPTEVWLKTI